jgi:hypothetical protein
MTATQVAAGGLEAARWEAEEVLTLQPDFTVEEWLQTSPMSDARQKQQIRALLAKAGL